MSHAPQVVSLNESGIVRVRGPDAVRFLQGQVSNDVTLLSAQKPMLCGYHNPQGRSIALLLLLLWEPDDILAIVPRELAGPVAARLAKFVLRARVKVTDDSSAWQIAGVISAAGGDAATPASARRYPVVGPSGRWLVIAPADTAPVDTAMLAAGHVSGELSTWERLDVEAGLPQVYAATSEEFVAQMLNLDAVGGVAFDKGCYTGQEVIARAHYRGRVKRRMQRFVSREAATLKPGASGVLEDGRAFKVVRAVEISGGRSDFLAVAPLAGVSNDGAVASSAAAAGATPAETAASTTGATAGPALAAEPAPLPYPLPD